MFKIFMILFLLVGCAEYIYLAETPTWYLNPPSDKHNLITSGYGESKHKQLALDMAVMAAKRSAADSIASDIKGRSKYYLSEGVSQGSEVAMIENINMRIENYRRIKTLIHEISNGYEVYVLLSFPQQFNGKIFSEIEQ
tara:strand:+ start:11506 stop:11922 length:417 start_codon:yes stop_codon:yes gene_type:complete